ncbi:ANK REP REGION domain-containing protein [Citrus sinensis]|nr:ANK REP REGION domain-containing protein [Citrus sinensis]
MLQSVLKTQISSQSQIDMDPELYDTAANGNSKTPLYIAAANGSVEIVTKILQNCPSPTRESLDGKTALHAAVYTYPTANQTSPLASSPPLVLNNSNIMNSDLYEAAAKGEIEPFNQLAIDRQLGSLVTHKKNTVLHVNIIASYTQNKEGESVSTKFVERIIEMCPSLLLQVNAKGDAPLHVAARYGHAAVVEALIEIAKQESDQEIESGVESTARHMLGMKNDEEDTALHEAVQSGSLDVVKILLGADPAFPYSANGSGETPLYLAAARAHKEISAEILQKCPSPAHEGPNGKTALHAAVCSRSCVHCFPFSLIATLSLSSSSCQPLPQAPPQQPLSPVSTQLPHSQQWVMKKSFMAIKLHSNFQKLGSSNNVITEPLLLLFLAFVLDFAIYLFHQLYILLSLDLYKEKFDQRKRPTRLDSLHYAAYIDRFGFFGILILRADKSAALIADKDRKMTALHLAAGQGNSWIARQIIDHCPECCELVDDRGWNVLHFAMVSFSIRQLKRLLNKYPVVRNLIFEKDEKGNTPFHVLAAVCPHPGNDGYDIVPWKIAKGYYQAVNKQNISVEHINRYGFPELEKEIEKLSKADGSGNYPDCVVKINKNKKRAFYPFWEYLEENVFGVEKASEYHLVVAALIATVTFAAAFTLPGGYKSDTEDGPNRGTAILNKNVAFQAFVISDAIAMVLSLSAVLFHFFLSLKLFEKSIFLFSFALWFTLVAMAAMIIAFVTGTYAVLAPSLGLAIVTCIIGLAFVFLVIFMFYMKNAAFQAFVIANAMAVVLSLSAVFIHFLTSTKTLRQMTFLVNVAHCFIPASMLAMTVAFVTGTSPMLAPSLRLSIANCVLGLNFILFVLFGMFKFACGLAQSSWLDKLNKPNKYNRLKPPQARVNYRKNNGNGVGGVDDGGSSSTMGKIVEKLKKFGYVGDGDGRWFSKESPSGLGEEGSIGISGIDNGPFPAVSENLTAACGELVHYFPTVMIVRVLLENSDFNDDGGAF